MTTPPCSRPAAVHSSGAQASLPTTRCGSTSDSSIPRVLANGMSSSTSVGFMAIGTPVERGSESGVTIPRCGASTTKPCGADTSGSEAEPGGLAHVVQEGGHLAVGGPESQLLVRDSLLRAVFD